jgi:hypothetical protein
MPATPLSDHLADVLVSTVAAPLAEIDQEAGHEARRRLRARARTLARELTGEDRSVAQSTAERIMTVAWRGRHASWNWWETELGQVIARALEGSTYGRAEVTRSEAASMLGISVSRIDQLTRAGRLEKLGTGVVRASILRLVVDERRQMYRKAKGL